MARHRPFLFLACAIASFCVLRSAAPQSPPAPSSARILLLPRRIVSGQRATLAVLDANGRLTPGVAVSFSNGDRVTTDATGRALFVAPLNPGVIFGSLTRTENLARFEVTGRKNGNFLISIRLVPWLARPRP